MNIVSLDMEWMIGKGSNEVDIGESLHFCGVNLCLFTCDFPPSLSPSRISTSYGDAFYPTIICDGEWDRVGH